MSDSPRPLLWGRPLRTGRQEGIWLHDRQGSGIFEVYRNLFVDVLFESTYAGLVQEKQFGPAGAGS